MPGFLLDITGQVMLRRDQRAFSYIFLCAVRRAVLIHLYRSFSPKHHWRVKAAVYIVWNFIQELNVFGDVPVTKKS